MISHPPPPPSAGQQRRHGSAPEAASAGAHPRHVALLPASVCQRSCGRRVPGLPTTPHRDGAQTAIPGNGYSLQGLNPGLLKSINHDYMLRPKKINH